MNALQHAIDPLSGPVRPRNRRRNPFWRFRRFLFLLTLVVAGTFGAVLFTFSRTPLPEDEFADIAQTSFLCTAEVTANCGPDNATVLLAKGGEDREIIPYADLPQTLIDAVIATEDQDFFNHQGVDPRGITRAAYQFVRQDGVVQGGSTITQQYVKLAFNDDDRTLIRKAREAIRAVKLEEELARECSTHPDLGDRTPQQCAKEEILSRYLNRAYFGRGASGVEAAARVYFGKEVGELDIAESAFLAGLLRNPNGADPDVDPDEANRRRTKSLELMLEHGYITVEEATAANEEEWNVVPRRDREGLGEVAGAEWGTEYFVEEVRQQLDELFPNGEIYTRGIRVYTTLDPRLQEAAYRAAHMPKPGEDLEARGKPQLGPTYLDPNDPNEAAAAIVSVDRDGRVVAMLGGTNFDESEFNLATSSDTEGRQPGSTFKPLGFALAIEQGISARSFYPAVPGVTRVGGPCVDADGPWQVTGGSSGQNRYRDLIDALTWSSNIVFAQLVVDVGPDQLRDFAHKLGVGSDLQVDLAGGGTATPCSIILGSEGVPVVDMASVYSTFERGGNHLEPVLIERVEDVDGEVICWYPVDGVCADGPTRAGEQVMAETTALQTTYALTQVAQSGTGRAAPFAEDRAIAGKTGTSQQSRDGWFAGYTCGLTTVVWMGFEGEETPMIDFRKPLPEGATEPPKDENGDVIDDRDWPNIEGGNMPTWIWSDYMEQATAGAPPCESLPMQSEFPGTRLNQDLSTTTLPPCGVELDSNGYPYGDGPDSFRYIPTTAAPTTTAPPPPDQTPGSRPEGPPLPNNNDPQQPAPEPTAPCVPPEVWAQQADPGAPVPTDPAGPTTIDPNATPTSQGESTTETDVSLPTTPSTGETTTSTTPTIETPPTEPPPSSDTQPPSSDAGDNG